MFQAKREKYLRATSLITRKFSAGGSLDAWRRRTSCWTMWPVNKRCYVYIVRPYVSVFYTSTISSESYSGQCQKLLCIIIHACQYVSKSLYVMFACITLQHTYSLTKKYKLPRWRRDSHIRPQWPPARIQDQTRIFMFTFLCVFSVAV